MRIAVMGAGGVGGYFGARLAQAGHDVAFVARGRHLAAMRERGLDGQERARRHHARAARRHRRSGEPRAGRRRAVRGQALGYRERGRRRSGRCSRTAASSSRSRTASRASSAIGAVVGAERVMGGVAYIAATIGEPGVIVHTGTMARLRFGPVHPGAAAGGRGAATRRARAPASTPSSSADIRRALWEKFAFLAAFSGLTSVARQPIGVAARRPRSARDARGGDTRGVGRRPRAAASRSPTISSPSR